MKAINGTRENTSEAISEEFRWLDARFGPELTELIGLMDAREAILAGMWLLDQGGIKLTDTEWQDLLRQARR